MVSLIERAKENASEFDAKVIANRTQANAAGAVA